MLTLFSCNTHRFLSLPQHDPHVGLPLCLLSAHGTGQRYSYFSLFHTSEAARIERAWKALRENTEFQLQIMAKEMTFCKDEETEENHYTQRINMLKRQN